ncbi:MAG: PAS domain S-box protein [Byssovorax sp.]
MGLGATTLAAQVIDHMPCGYALCQMVFDGDSPVDFIYLATNRAFGELTGLHHVVGKRVTEVIPGIAALDPELLERYGRVVRTGEPMRFEQRVRSLDTWFVLSVFHAEEDRFVALFDVVSRHKETERALLRNKASMAALLASLDDLVFTIDPAGHFVSFHGTHSDALLMPEAAFIGRHFREVLPGEVAEPLAAVLERVTATGETGQMEYWMAVPQHPEPRFWSSKISPIKGRDADGEDLGFVIVTRDITDRKRVEDALRLSETRFRTIFDLLPAGLLQADAATGRFVAVNPVACSILGRTRDEVLQIGIAEMTHPDDRARDLEGFGRLVRGEIDRYRTGKRVVRKDGSIVHCNVDVVMLHDGGRAPPRTLALLEDVSERDHAIAALKESEEQLRAAQKMEAVGRLAGGVAHDFNNLLSVILSYTELGMEELRPEDPLRLDLEEVVKAGKRAEALTRQLLAFSRKQVLAPEQVDIDELIGGISKMLRRLIGEDIELVVSHGEGPVGTMADKGQLEQVLLNLAVNARDAMPDGGKLTIATDLVELDPARAAALEMSPGTYVRLSVTDTGIGMDMATQRRIFEPFFTTKGVGKGTGLGLSTVYGIIRQSGGGIAVETAPGQGASFRIYLPRSMKTSVFPELPPPVVRRDHGHETILVVEDEDGLRHVVQRLLNAEGYKVICAANPGEAVLLCEERHDRFDLVLTDVVMPGMNGKQLVERLKPMCSKARIIYMTGYTDDTIARLDVPAHSLLRKPFDRRTLIDKVRSALG